MPKKRIALLLPSLANGGAERVMLNIAHGLARDENLEVDLVLSKAEGPYLEQVDSSVRVVDLGCRRIIFSFLPILNYLKKEKPDSVLSALDTVNVVLIWASRVARSKARIVVSVHCNFSSALKGQKNYRSKLLPWLVRKSYGLADKVLAVSRGVAEDLTLNTGVERGLPIVQVNPVITPELVAKAQEPCDHRWIKQGVPVLLATGRMTYQKNFGLLIEAFSKVRQTNYVKLIILGEGEEREQLQDLVEKYELQEHVDFPGFVENPYCYMRNSSLFVLSSRYEGLPTVLIEALYCGVPIVTTDCPSGPSEILENGRLGKLVPVDDVDAMAEAIVRQLVNSEMADGTDSLKKYFLDEVVSSYKRHLTK